MAKSSTKASTKSPTAAAVVAELKKLGSAKVRSNMGTRFGIRGETAETAFGVAMVSIQKVVKAAKTKDPSQNHALALALWDWKGPGRYEAQMAAPMIDAPALVTAAQMDAWAKTFDNWATCDTACFKLFDRVPDTDLIFRKVEQWSKRKAEFERRASMALIASFALHEKAAPDSWFIPCLPIIERVATDERNFVKKGVSWALRGIGQRSPALRTQSVAIAAKLAISQVACERWIGKDVLRALELSRATKGTAGKATP